MIYLTFMIKHNKTNANHLDLRAEIILFMFNHEYYKSFTEFLAKSNSYLYCRYIINDTVIIHSFSKCIPIILFFIKLRDKTGYSTFK